MAKNNHPSHTDHWHQHSPKGTCLRLQCATMRLETVSRSKPSRPCNMEPAIEKIRSTAADEAGTPRTQRHEHASLVGTEKLAKLLLPRAGGAGSPWSFQRVVGSWSGGNTMVALDGAVQGCAQLAPQMTAVVGLTWGPDCGRVPGSSCDRPLTKKA